MKMKTKITVKKIRKTETKQKAKIMKNEDLYEDLEAEEEIDEDELAYLEEGILNDDYNLSNKVQDAPIKGDQEDIEILGVNEISDTYSTIEEHQICFRLGSYFMASVLAAASYSRAGFSLCLAGIARLVMVPGVITFHL